MMEFVHLVFGKAKYALVPVLLCMGVLIQSAFAQDEEIIYVPQAGTPAGIANFIQPEGGCNWSGIGGQVFDRDGAPVTGLVVKLAGSLESQEVLIYAVTGGALQFGPGGYLIPLADHLVSTNGQVSLQILDLTGNELSSPVPIFTHDLCGRNLLLVNIRELVIKEKLYLPLIHN